MKLLDSFSKSITRKKEKQFKDLHGLLLCLLGASAFLVAGYLGLMLKDVVPPLITATNKAGFSSFALKFWLLFGCYALALWFVGCIAARCHAVQYERWFK